MGIKAALIFALFLAPSLVAARSLEFLATTPYVPKPKDVQSLTEREWCIAADLALSNPSITPINREDWIAAGQKMHCQNQLALPPRAESGDLCGKLFILMGNRAVDPILKEAALEKARNRGCLK